MRINPYKMDGRVEAVNHQSDSESADLINIT